jgi:hypothetical protein
MKVLCIDASGRSQVGSTTLKENKVYDAAPVKSHCNIPAYDLSLPNTYTVCGCGYVHNGAIFDAKRFVPISSIDETELLEQREALLQSL